MKPLNVQIPESTRAALDKQAENVGALTANVWAGMILTTICQLDASTALKLMGKAKELRRSPRRISEL